MHRVRQVFPAVVECDVETRIAQLYSGSQLAAAGERVAIGVGSRGISNYSRIVKGAIAQFRKLGAEPFLVPAMGSHGGATPEGQLKVLAGHGITEESHGVPIHAEMDAENVGQTKSGMDVWFSKAALSADRIFVINRIKPHTDFSEDIGSGCLKMLTVGMGKHVGAANYHQNAVRIGYAEALKGLGDAILSNLPIAGGLGIIEGQRHETVSLELLEPEDWITREEELVLKVKSGLPKIPLEDIDLLVVDQIGKNFSGTGMDSNVIGRGVHSYSTLTGREHTNPPHIRRIYVRDLAPETNGNAIGLGLADFVHQRVVDQMDVNVTYTNALTALSLNACKVPITMSDERQVVELALSSVGALSDPSARILRIENTLDLEFFDVSDGLLSDVGDNSKCERLPVSYPIEDWRSLTD